MPDGTTTRQGRSIRDARGLVAAGLIPPGAEADAAQVAARYAVAITPHVAGLIGDASDPIGLQYIPDPAELVTAPGELDDPTADGPFTPVRGVVHRYPDRALLKPLLACPVYCRFCFRREVVGPDGGVLTEAELDAALAWFEGTPAVREAVLTGGDPFMLSARRLGAILARLGAVPHIETLRVHTRVPVADPGRVDGALVAALRGAGKPVFVAVHANHAREFAGPALEALARLADAGVVLLGQSVLLRGVNDSGGALEDLVRAMVRARVRPYYLHALDPAPGVGRFSVPDAKGVALVEGLRGKVPGFAVPVFVRESENGGGKKPVSA
ncbi:lysine-2,3-aminomutase-like protein [Roseomonas fluvialis]|uniref:Lysine 2,3-aminomutase n=1 Tax=Roseomonas fluvialis TaxID=1750527 RepID=A0ABN6NYG2_9PROT|nr:lysine-2,3-aminomutase-like protein [Roseomonas fluvialis]BDG71458.1 lysine 2,3-aminomutase [Roseomonas fluvialis]